MYLLHQSDLAIQMRVSIQQLQYRPFTEGECKQCRTEQIWRCETAIAVSEHRVMIARAICERPLKDTLTSIVRNELDARIQRELGTLVGEI
ncbi:MAG: hypothetical protein CYG59_20995 [Chloroflexi bacterium]|nr:MAG: hypothetical protein CYG59_20995 [Chloroflexota bacterium]